MSKLEEYVYLAKLAEQAERYEGKITYLHFVYIVDTDESIRDGGEYEGSGFCRPGALR